MTTQTATSPEITKLEEKILDFFKQGNLFLLSDSICLLRKAINQQMGDIYRTPDAVEMALVERVEAIRETLIFAELAEAQALAEAGDRNFEGHASKAFAFVARAINDYKHPRDYSWMKNAARSLENKYNEKRAPENPLLKPMPLSGRVSKEDLDRHMKESPFFKIVHDDHKEIDRLVYQAFIDNDTVEIKANAQLLYRFLSQFYTGEKLNEAFERRIEDNRELAILDLFTGAKTLAEKGNDAYRTHLKLAVSIRSADIGIQDYKIPYAERYDFWFENTCEEISGVYITNTKMK